MSEHLFGAEHVRRYLETDGEVGYRWRNDAPILILTTTGRKSGEARLRPLIFGEDDGRYVVVASQGGRPTHPDWYLNLTAHPDVQVQIKGDRFPARRAHGRGRGTRAPLAADGADLASVRRLPAEDRAPDPRRRARSRALTFHAQRSARSSAARHSARRAAAQSRPAAGS